MRKIFAKIMILVILTIELMIPVSWEIYASDIRWTGCNPTFVSTDGRGMVNGYFKSSDDILVSIPGATMDTSVGKDGTTTYPYRYGGVALVDRQPTPMGELGYAISDRGYNIYRFPGVYTGSQGREYVIPETVGCIKASELAKYRYLIAMQGSKNNAGDIIASDKAIYTYRTYEVKLDDTKPTVEIQTKGTGPNGSAYTGVKVSVNASDNQSKIGRDAYSFSYDEEAVNWQNESSYEAIENGTLYIKVRDGVGNIASESVEISGIDCNPPTIDEAVITPVNPVMRDGIAYAKSALVSISANDVESGLHSEAYGYGYGDSVSEDEMNFSDNSEFIVSQNGIWTILVRDAALNETTGTIEISCIDKQGPRIVDEMVTSNPDINGYGKEAVISPVIEEEGCGFDEQPFSYDGGESYTNQSSVTLYENGTYMLVYKDALGNKTESQVSVNCIDRESPYILQITDESLRSDNGYAKEAQIKIAAFDDKSGLHSEAFSLDKGASYQDSDTFVIDEEGEYEVTVRDGLGNRTSKDFLVERIDREAPVFVKRTVEALSAINGYGTRAVMNVSAFDSKSGLDKKSFSYDEGKTYVSSNSVTVDTNKIYTVMVRDAVGNVAKTLIDVACVDSQGPGIVISGNPNYTVNSDVELTVSISDVQSGISSLWYQNDSIKSPKAIGNYSSVKSAKEKVTIKQNGSYTFFAYDELGNMSKKTISVTKIDRNASSKSSSKSSTTKNTTGSSSTKKSSSSTAKQSDSSSSIKTNAIIIGGKSDKEDEDDVDVKTVTIKNSSSSDRNSKKENSGSIGTKTLIVGLSDNEIDENNDPDNKDQDMEDTDVSDINDVILNEDASNGSFYSMEKEYSEGVYDEKLAEGPVKESVSQERIVPNPDANNRAGSSPLVTALIVIVVMLIILGIITAILIKLGVIPAAQILADLRSQRERLKADRDESYEDETDIL